MKSYEIDDAKEYLESLFASEKFNSFYMLEASVKADISYFFRGELNSAYIDEDEKEQDGDKNSSRHIKWSLIKETLEHIVLRESLPTELKLCLMFNRDNIESLIEKNNLPLSIEDVSNLSINIYYANELLLVTTGTALNKFTMDKSLEHLWDETVEKYYLK